MKFKLNLSATISLLVAVVVSLFTQGAQVLQPTATYQPVLVSPSHPVNIDDIDEISDYYKITYPVPELGNCANFAECLKYCEDPVNYNGCSEFAKKKGFYQEDPIYGEIDKLYQQAKAELGCDSATACIEYCTQVTSFDACDVFAKKLELLGGYIDSPDKPKFLEKAKAILGCDSYAACQTFCDDPANSQKCSDFANQVGLLGGQVTEGPGGCISETTCQSYCSDPANFSECSKFVPPNTGSFTGPGGCNSPESCRSYCETNSDNCRSYAPGSNGVYVPINCPAGQYFGPGGVCTAQEKSAEASQCASAAKFWNGTACQDQPPPGITSTVGSAYFQPRPEMGNCKTPGECYDYCKANPGKCSGFDTSAPRPTDNYIPSLYYTPGTVVEHPPVAEMGNCATPGACYDWCRENTGKCTGFDTSAPRPSDTYIPGTYYTPPSDYTYYTPPATNYYVTPVYYTPPAGSNYTTPSYYTPGSYYTPNYYTPPAGSNYTVTSYPTPTYYTPYYPTPTYYTPPEGSNYTTPSYYTPPPYSTPSYYTPPAGSNYTTPTYYTPPPYYTPTYPTPSGTYSYPSPGYYYPTPSGDSGGYPTPSSYSYPSPSYAYPTPSYGTPGSYPTPSYGTPESYPTPSYGTPESYPYPTPVQGVSTKRNFFQVVWDFLFRR